MHSRASSPAQKAARPESTGTGTGDLQRAADQSPATARLDALNRKAVQFAGAVMQRVWSGEIDASTSDSDMLQELDKRGYDTGALRPWKIAALRTGKTAYDSFEKVAIALSLSKSDGGATTSRTESVTVVSQEVVTLAPELASVATLDVPVPESGGSETAKPTVPSGKAHRVVSRAQAAAERLASAEKSGKKDDRPPMIDTGRPKIYAPEDDRLVVFRAEKSERNTLEDRQAQGGLEIWRPSSASAQEAYERMFELITGGQTLGEFQFRAALNTYAQNLRAEGQPDNLATARTVEGAFVDDFNYTITIPGVRLFQWTSSGIGARIQPGAEIKQHYIVLDADTIPASTILGIGHVTGTQEVSFYTKIPAEMITSVQKGSFDAEKKTFKKVETPSK